VITGVGLGQEERFRPPSLSGRCRFGEATFAETRGNGRDAPIPDFRGLTPETERFDPKAVSRYVARINSAKTAYRMNVKGIITGPDFFMWNVEKTWPRNRARSPAHFLLSSRGRLGTKEVRDGSRNDTSRILARRGGKLGGLGFERASQGR
jgi:hypothetical protein